MRLLTQRKIAERAARNLEHRFLKVPCPLCGAQIGEMCVSTKTGRALDSINEIHNKRAPRADKRNHFYARA